MLLEHSSLRFSPEEVSRSLHLPQRVVDAIVSTGLIDASSGSLSAAAIENLLRDTLLRLYRTEARTEEVTIDLPEAAQREDVAGDEEETPDPDVVRQSLAEYQTEALRQRENKRVVARYKPRRQLGGMFRQSRFTILQISDTGLRIRHDDSLRPGDEARVTFSLVQPPRTFALKARVVWTSIAQRGSGPSFCISGLEATAGSPQLHEAIRALLAARDLELEPEDASVTTAKANLAGLSDEDVASVIRTMRLLMSDPVEANRWYTRARFALADSEVRAAAPTRARDREEALAVWEYLGRRLNLKAVAGVLSWMRSTRSAAAY